MTLSGAKGWQKGYIPYGFGGRRKYTVDAVGRRKPPPAQVQRPLLPGSTGGGQRGNFLMVSGAGKKVVRKYTVDTVRRKGYICLELPRV